MKLKTLSYMIAVLIWTAFPGAYNTICFAQEGLFDTAELAANSQVIVIGSIQYALGEDNSKLTLNALRVLKGSIQLGQPLLVNWTPPSNVFCSIQTMKVSPVSIWFLQPSPDGDYEFAPFLKSQACYSDKPAYAAESAPPASSLVYKANDDPAIKIAKEIAWALLQSGGEVPTAVTNYSGVFSGIRMADEALIATSLYASPVKSVQMIGLIGLIHSAQVEGMTQISTNASILASTTLPSNIIQIDTIGIHSATGATANDQTYEKQIARAISGIRDVADNTIQSLATVLTNQDNPASIRRAASHSLRNIHTPSAVLVLASYMTDSDDTVSTNAVAGVSCLANGVPILNDSIPGQGLNLNMPSQFKTDATMAHFVIGPMGDNNSSLRAFWEDWWHTNKAAVMLMAAKRSSSSQ